MTKVVNITAGYNVAHEGIEQLIYTQIPSKTSAVIHDNFGLSLQFVATLQFLSG